jgi:hypothetical protein
MSHDQHEMRLKIPPSMLEEFQRNPRVIFKFHPAGLWPIDIGILIKGDLLEKLQKDKVFMENYDVVLMPKEQTAF